MAIRERLSGNEAVATAMKQINPDVVAAYPITPSTEIPQYFSTFVDNGQVTTEFIPVESEHSAMSACIGASAAGARVMTATSSQGLAYMYEVLNIASGLRLPIVLICGNRAISAPLNIHNDHSDSMGVRDSGFIQLYCENNQEAYDNTIMAIRIAEETSIPVMVCYDGFITSHSVENITLLEDEKVKDFIGEFKPKYTTLLDPEKNVSIGPLALQDSFFEFKKQLADDMENSKDVISKVSKEYAKLTGREYNFYEKYLLDDADIGIVVLNSSAGTAKTVVDDLRANGIKAGLLKPRTFIPLPWEEIANDLKNLKALAVLDKADSYNAYSGPLFAEITSALYSIDQAHVPTVNYIYGLGGRDVRTVDIEKVYNDLQEIIKTKKINSVKNYLNVNE